MAFLNHFALYAKQGATNKNIIVQHTKHVENYLFPAFSGLKIFYIRADQCLFHRVKALAW